MCLTHGERKRNKSFPKFRHCRSHHTSSDINMQFFPFWRSKTASAEFGPDFRKPVQLQAAPASLFDSREFCSRSTLSPFQPIQTAGDAGLLTQLLQASNVLDFESVRLKETDAKPQLLACLATLLVHEPPIPELKTCPLSNFSFEDRMLTLIRCGADLTASSTKRGTLMKVILQSPHCTPAVCYCRENWASWFLFNPR